MSTNRDTRAGRRTVLWLLGLGLLASLLMAGVAAYYASPHPDGLESVAEQQGFAADASDSATARSPLSDYGVAGVQNDRVSVGLAGVIGVAVTAAVAFGLFRLLRRGTARVPGRGSPDRG